MAAKRYLTILSVILAACAGNAGAQLHENVAVEGRYEPIVIETERINTYPTAMKFEMQTPDLKEETAGVVTGFQPSLLTMGFSGWQTTFRPTGQKGYIDLNLGSWLNSNLSAGFRPLCDSRNILHLALQFNSTSLYGIKNYPSGMTPLSKKYLYDGTVSANWNHKFSKTVQMDASLAYRLAHFDYYGSLAASNSPAVGKGAPDQTLNDIDFKVTFSGNRALPKGWYAGVGVRYFGYRSFYTSDFPTSSHIPGARETEISMKAGYAAPLNENSTLNIDADGELLLYAGNRFLSEPYYTNNNYGKFTFRPSYRYNNTNFNLKIGAVLDLTANASGDTPGTKYSFFHIAPDVQLQARNDKLGFRLGVTGGSRLMTLASREQLDYYQSPALTSTQPMYTPLDAEATLSAGPFSGFFAEFGGGYDITLHSPLGGMYQMLLGGYSEGFSSLGGNLMPTEYLKRGVNLHGAKLKLRLNYTYSTLLEAGGSLVFTPQNGETGVFNGYDRSKWIVDARISVRPIKKLRIDLDYNFKGERKIYGYFANSSAGGSDAPLTGIKLANISDLRAGVAYSITDRFNIYCRAANLLNRRIDFLPGLQSQGVTVCGGFDLIF